MCKVPHENAAIQREIRGEDSAKRRVDVYSAQDVVPAVRGAVHPAAAELGAGQVDVVVAGAVEVEGGERPVLYHRPVGVAQHVVEAARLAGGRPPLGLATGSVPPARRRS